MIDTIILRIPWGSYMITDHKKFTPSTENLRLDASSGFGARGFSKYTQNPTPTDHKLGNYLPRLTITPRYTPAGLQIPLKIEFSVPKLLYGNNLEELADEDFERVIDLLSEKLKIMGIRIFKATLQNSSVSVIHFSKNIPLTGHYTASYAIRELGKLDVTKKLDLNNRHFQNDGHALYFYAGSYSLVLYDKMKDISLPRSRAVDKDEFNGQLSLFEPLQAHKLPKEVLRFEIRITNKQKLNSLLTILGYKTNPTFKEVFNKELSSKVLLYYWNFIYSKQAQFILKFEEKPDKLLPAIVQHYKSQHKKIPAKQALSILGTMVFTREHGLRAFRNSIASNYSDRTWFRLSKLLSQASEITSNRKPFGFVEDIQRELAEFNPYRVALEGSNTLQ